MNEEPVTKVMIMAGHAEWVKQPFPGYAEFFINAYRAMRAVAPVDLVPQGERAALKERDELRARFSCLQVVNAQQSAELALLRAQLAGFTAANVAPATPEPELAFLRVLRRGNRAPAGIIGGMGDRP